MSQNIEDLIANAQAQAAQTVSTATPTSQQTEAVAVGQQHAAAQTAEVAEPAVQQTAVTQQATQTVQSQAAPVNTAAPAPVTGNQIQLTPEQLATLPPEVIRSLQGGAVDMDSVPQGSVAADWWLRFTDTCMFFKKMQGQPMLKPLYCEITMTEGVGFQLVETVKIDETGPDGKPTTRYVSRRPGEQNGLDGHPWVNTVLNAFNSSKNPGNPNTPYHSVQLPLPLAKTPETLTGEALPESVPAGSIVAFSTSKTAWGNWTKFYQTCKVNNLIGKTVYVEIGHQKIEYNNMQWGVPTFKCLGEKDPQQAIGAAQH